MAVYFVHSQLYYGYRLDYLNKYIHPFYVNTFFFISGYLLFRKQLNTPIIEENHKQYLINGGGKYLISNVLHKLIIPSTIFAAIEFIPKNIVRGKNIEISALIWETVGGGTYWFTSALVVAEVLMLILFLSRCRSMWMYLFTSIAFFFSGNYLVDIRYNLLGLTRDFWLFKHGLLASVFLVAGGLYWKYESWLHKFMNKYVLLVLLVCYMSILIFYRNSIRVLISTLDINSVGLLVGCFISVILIELCKLLPAIKVLTFIGQNSISFYFMSGALPIVLSMVIRKLVIANYWGLLVVWIGALIVAYVATIIMNRYLPWLFDLRKLRNGELKN